MRLNSLGLEVSSLAYSADGREIVVVAKFTSVRILDAKTFRQKAEYTIGEHQLRIAIFSPNGDHIIVGCFDGAVFRLSAQSGEVTIVLTGHSDALLFLGYTRNGQILVTGSRDGVIQFWEANSCVLRKVVNAPNKIGTLDISPDGTLLATAPATDDPLGFTEEETQITLWDAETGGELAMLTGHAAPLYCLAFSPDSKHLLSGGGGYLSGPDKSVRLWDIKTRTQIREFAGHSSGITDVKLYALGYLFERAVIQQGANRFKYDFVMGRLWIQSRFIGVLISVRASRGCID